MFVFKSPLFFSFAVHIDLYRFSFLVLNRVLPAAAAAVDDDVVGGWFAANVD